MNKGNIENQTTDLGSVVEPVTEINPLKKPSEKEMSAIREVAVSELIIVINKSNSEVDNHHTEIAKIKTEMSRKISEHKDKILKLQDKKQAEIKQICKKHNVNEKQCLKIIAGPKSQEQND